MGKTVRPGSGQSSGRVNYSEGSGGRLHRIEAVSTNPRAANPNKSPSSKPPVHGWQNGSYCPNCGQGMRVGGGCGCGTLKSAAQMPQDMDAIDDRRSQSKRPTTPGDH